VGWQDDQADAVARILAEALDAHPIKGVVRGYRPAAQDSAPAASVVPPLPPSLLDSAVAKINQADKHFKALNEAINAWVELEPYGAVVDRQGQTGKIILRATERIKPPDSISVALGDYVHNLRSALDHVAWAAAISLQNPPVSATAFPIYHDVTSFDENRPRYIEAMWAADQARIKRAQPYWNLKTKDPLFWVQQLDNTDKHRLLVVVAAGAVMSGLGINELWGFDITEMNVYGARPLKEGTPVASLRMTQTASDARMTMNPHFAYEVRFGDGVEYVGRLPVLATAVAMRRRVVEVLGMWRYE
jgi:hypothetical protein